MTSQNLSSSSVAQRLEQLKQHADVLTTRATRAQVQLETARKQYDEAVAEAQRDFKTSDLSALRAQLASAEAENAKSVEAYAQAVDEFEKYLVRIETALTDPEAMAALVDAISSQGKPESSKAPQAAAVEDI